MNRARALGVLAAVVVTVGIAVALLATGGADEEVPRDDPAQDVSVGQGSPPADTSLADIIFADVYRSGTEIVFEGRLTATIPNRLKKKALDLRWEIFEDGARTWIVFATLDFGPTAYVKSETTQFAASTIDETMPGAIAVSGNTLTIRLRAGELEGFPDAFEWSLGTTFDADEEDTASAVATDRAPDDGLGELEEE